MTRIKEVDSVLLHPYRIYYGDFLGKQSFLNLSNDAKGEYLRFLNILTLGNVQMISLVLSIKLDKVCEMMYEFELAPDGDSLEPEAPSLFYQAIKDKEERLLKERHIETNLVIPVERIILKYSAISAGIYRGAFDTAYDEIIAKEIKAIDDLFCDYLTDDDVRKGLEEFRLEQDKRIKSEENLSLMPNRGIRWALREAGLCSEEDLRVSISEKGEILKMKKRKIIEHAKLTSKELKSYTCIEDVIGKPANKMTANDVSVVANGCPINPVAEWSKVKNDVEYLRQLRLYFQHISIIKIAQGLFCNTVDSGTLGKKFINLKVKVPAINRWQAKEFELEHLAFDRWISCGSQTAKDATGLIEIVGKTTSQSQALSSSDKTIPSKKYHETDTGSAKDGTAAVNQHHLSVEIAGDDPVQLYALYIELLEHYRNDPRGKVLLNPFMS